MSLREYTPGEDEPTGCDCPFCEAEPEFGPTAEPARPGLLRSWATVIVLVLIGSAVTGGVLGVGCRAFKAVAP